MSLLEYIPRLTGCSWWQREGHRSHRCRCWCRRHRWCRCWTSVGSGGRRRSIRCWWWRREGRGSGTDWLKCRRLECLYRIYILATATLKIWYSCSKNSVHPESYYGKKCFNILPLKYEIRARRPQSWRLQVLHVLVVVELCGRLWNMLSVDCHSAKFCYYDVIIIHTLPHRSTT